MYITCEQCSTIFRLDEKRLKPSGSKVRCSQCSSIFIAWPMASTQVATAAQAGTRPATAAPPPQQSEDMLDQELEGIDLAELDSILERDRKVDSEAGGTGDESQGEIESEETIELDAADLDMDFESALALDEEPQAVAEPAESEELDLDMDFELEPESQAGDLDKASGDVEFEDDLNMDFELDSGIDLQAEDLQDEQNEREVGAIGEEEIEMALDDFEDVLDTPEKIENDMPPGEEVAEDDLSLDMDLDFGEERDHEEREDQELDLSLDDDGTADTELESMAGAGETPVPGENEDIDLADLGDLLDEDETEADVREADEQIELSLDEDMEAPVETEPALEEELPETAASEGGVPGTGDDDLDLSGFDDLLDEEHEAEEKEPLEEELSLDDDGAFDLDAETDFESEAAAAAETVAPAGDLQDDGIDLDGLDSLLDEESGEAEKPEPEDLELSLEDDAGGEPLDEAVLTMEKEETSDEDLGGIEDLEFELDAEFEDKPISKTASAEQIEESEEADEELDLSDIEKMLEDDSLAPEAAAPAAESDLDLVGGAEKWVDDASQDGEMASDGELDLTEIEAAIDDADESLDVKGDDDQELELDLEPFDDAVGEDKQEGQEEEEFDLSLEMEKDTSAGAGQTIGDDTDGIDLSDIDLSIEEEKQENEIINAGDIELEFQVEEDQLSVIDSAETLAGQSQATAGFGDTTAVPEEDEKSLIDEAFAAEPKVEKPAEKPKPVQKKKKGSGKSLIVILILALLGAGGYYGYDYVIKNNITIPYLSDYINPKPKDPSGTALLSTLEINSKFIENEKAGRIFVVTGKVRNGYKVPRRMIRLQGKLFIKGKVLAKTEQAYAGIVVSDADLASQDIAGIKQRLKAPGGQAAGLVVNPGQTIPFMVVFSELPADLDEFAIELTRSSKVQ